MLAVMVIGASAAFGREPTDGFGVPDSDPHRAEQLLERAGADEAGLTAEVVLTPKTPGATFTSSAQARDAARTRKWEVDHAEHGQAANEGAEGAPVLVQRGGDLRPGAIGQTVPQLPDGGRQQGERASQTEICCAVRVDDRTDWKVLGRLAGRGRRQTPWQVPDATSTPRPPDDYTPHQAPGHQPNADDPPRVCG